MTQAGAIVIALAAILVGTNLLGWLARRVGQPGVLGELLAGILLGGSLLGVVDPAQPTIALIAEIGVVILLFEIGLETDVRQIARVGGAAMTVAVVGVVLPFLLGYVALSAFGLSGSEALVCGAALCATSVGITARVLADLGKLESDEGRVILGAAVIDDVIGLAILAVVAWRVAGTSPDLASIANSAKIVIAFGAGLAVRELGWHHRVARGTGLLRYLVVPVFFAAVGAAVDLRAMTDSRSLGLGAALIVAGVLGKTAAGYAPRWFAGDRTLVGLGMIPRGEVGLIFAQMGLTSAAIDAGEFGALMLMVLVTTCITPPLLAWRVSRTASRLPSSSPRSTTP